MASNIRVIPTPVGQGSALIIPGSTAFERANSDYLEITPSTDGNEKTFTVSWWFRLTETPGTAGAAGQSFFVSTSTPSNSENVQIYLSDDTFIINTRHEGGSWTSTKPARRFRDNAAWYHMVVAIDTTQSTGTDRLKIYINGELNSDWTSDGRASITQNTDLNFCSATPHWINNQGTWSNVYGQFSMSHFYIIDGQALDASNFGYTDPLTNTWRPKKFSGSYTTTYTIDTANSSALPILDTDDNLGETASSPEALRSDGNSGSLSLALVCNSTGNLTDDKSSNSSDPTNNGVTASTTKSHFYGTSARFDGADWMATPSSSTFDMSTGDFTVEAWINLDNFDIDVGANPTIFGNSGGSYQQQVYVTGAGKVIAGNSGSNHMESTTTLVAGTWYHIAVTRDSSTGRLFINGNLEDTESSWTTDLGGTTYYIGAFDNGSNGKIEGYMQDVRIYKGVAKYTSSFIAPGTEGGTNSCYLPLDGTGYSAFQTIGNMVQDQSGRQNNWTKNGSPTFSTDTPSGVALSIDNNAGITTTGVPTNYCTLNPLNKNSNGDSTEGNLVWYRNGNWSTILGTVGANTGKWYFELTHIGGTSSEVLQIGIAQEDHSLVDDNPLGGSTIWRKGIGWISSTGAINSNGGNDGFGTWADGDTVGCAVDIDEKKIWFHKNGTWILSRGGSNPASGSIGDPALGTHPIFDPSSESSLAVGSDNGCNILPGVASQYGKGRVNFGQTAFAYAPPKGFKPWCTANIPQTDLVRPDEYCKPLAVIGNGDTQKIEFGFQPDLLFVKPRTATTGGSWNITDSVRGGSVYLMTNSQNGNGSFSSPYGIAEWAEYGVTVKDQTNGDWNLNGNPGGTYSGTTGGYAYYGWKAGGNKNTFNINGVGYASAADAGITEGDISLTAASINTKDGFSIITYVGTGNNGDTVAHGLTKEPAFVIAKKYAADESGNWGVYHQGFTANTKAASLNLMNHEATPTDAFWTWSSTTTNLLGLGFNSITNDSTETTIAYLWADIQGVQKFGSYTGNGAKKFVYLGFKPAIVLVKRIVANSSPDTSTDYTSWTWMDSARLSYNGMTPNHLFANHNEPEGYRGNGSSTSSLGDMTMEPMSSGFYLKGPGSEVNASTGTYIYCAWAETPFQNLYGAQSNAR